ncbi:MAG: NAD(P)/FAD-dependent oxidoreductase [Gemmatimonadetes bacterium]|nr:NAD(P)/FAD-dependent oxidoreductase [Gemmatimonadota bacterium]
MSGGYDAVVVGSGPNGLAAAITLAQAGRRVLVREMMDTPGGGLRSMPLTFPGFVHDVCSAVHPLGVSSPFFLSLPLHEHGLEWVYSPASMAHPFDDGSAAVLERSLEATGATLGSRHDAKAWRRMMEPFVDGWLELAAGILSPLRFPQHPFLMARFGLLAVRSAVRVATGHFEGEHARALFAGSAGHSVVPLDRPPTAAFGLTLTLAGHAVGWPVARGGSQSIADALISYLRSLGGEIRTGAPVENIDELAPVRTILLDLTPRQILRVAGHRLPDRYRRALERFRYGPGSFKVDWALDGPIPWKAPECARAGTVHVGGTLAEIVASEDAPSEGRISERPLVLVGQPTLFDRTRAPEGKHVAWGYCHVPFGSGVDMTERIEAQVERFAPGFRDLILERRSMGPVALERHDPNLVGGDISGGMMDVRQLFFRPTARPWPYPTPIEGVYVCSSSTPPGGAVHGMCGYYAARSALGESLDPPIPE